MILKMPKQKPYTLLLEWCEIKAFGKKKETFVVNVSEKLNANALKLMIRSQLYTLYTY